MPAILALDWEGCGGGRDATEEAEGRPGGAWLLMEWIDGLVVRVILERWEAWMKRCGTSTSGGGNDDEKEISRVRDLLRRIGRAVGGLHRAGVIHGDLTTSNLMLRPSSTAAADTTDGDDEKSPSMEGEVVLIDFGLAMQSNQDEDQAVDLYVLERAFGSTHPRTEPLFEELLHGYRETYRGAVSTLKRLEEVRMRGRKRSMIG